MNNGTGAKRRWRRRTITVIGLAVATVAAVAVPALAHPSFPNVGPGFANPTGGTGAGTQTPPYAPGSTNTLNLRMPFERDGVIFQGAVNTTVDVKVTVPAGWTNPACGAASTSVGSSQVGTVVPGWSCALETADSHDVLHWSGPQVSSAQTAADSAQFFTFQVTVPSPANQTSYGAFGGPEGFFAVQRYADGDTSIWKCPNDPRPATDVATGLVRTVAGTSPPPPPPPVPLPPPVVRASDGKIAFQSARDGNNEIYVMNADGTGVIRLTTDPQADSQPAFSPDGTRIAFIRRPDTNRDVYIMNANGSGQTRLTDHPASDGGVVFTPDGRIGFHSNRDGNNNEIYLMHADGSGVTRLTNHPADDQRPTFSPDGTKFAFFTDRSGNREINVTSTDGSSGALNLTNNPAGDEWASWATVPDPILACRPGAPVPAGYHVIIGTSGNETLLGTFGRDIIHGLAGDDAIIGLGGDDIACAGLGNDTVDGGVGDDQISGYYGKDTLIGGVGNDRLSGGAGTDLLLGGPDTDTGIDVDPDTIRLLIESTG